ncbi:MAG: HDIG domain-containing protein [Muribaculaceae bacterium]|nr:HDIG domain-containing protein [Muribaculaceae bacterium]
MSKKLRISPTGAQVSGYRWLKWLILIVSVVVVAYCMPRESRSNYVYESGRPWNYSLLTAPFDIPITLDSLSAQRARDSIDMRFEPVYVRDALTDKNAVNLIASLIQSNPQVKLSPGERNRLINEIRRIYDMGIVTADTYAEIRTGRLRNVRMIHDNTAVSIPTSNYLSARAAYSRLDSVLADQRYRTAIAAIRLPELLTPNVLLDSITTARMLNESYQKATAAKGMIQQGQRIIDRGEIVTPVIYTVLQNYEELLAEHGGEGGTTDYYPIMGKVLYLLLLFGTIYAFLYFFRPDYFSSPRVMAFIMLMTVSFILFAFFMSGTFSSGLYMVPFCIVAIVTLVFLDSRTAFFVYMTTIMGCASVAAFPYEFIFIEWIAGAMAIISIKGLTKRSELIRTAVIVLLAYALSYLAVELIQGAMIGRSMLRMMGSFLINAVFICFAYIMVFLLEKLFGFTSRVTLVELSDINHPLLRELSEECPGTFQHSMAVSNLATAAANRIGANVQLVRAGALYHDIGKIANPAFFTENQHGVNPHDTLDPMQSARIVISHVTEGLKRAERSKLPAVLRSFISEHHGRGKARYFYTTWCNNHPGQKPDDAAFTYPGPNPQSRETSILMMADAVEAASRSLTDHSPEAISSLVNKIIDSQIVDGLHNESPISFRDVRDIKDTFSARLRTMFHGRIPYPELKKNAEQPDMSLPVLPPAHQSNPDSSNFSNLNDPRRNR